MLPGPATDSQRVPANAQRLIEKPCSRHYAASDKNATSLGDARRDRPAGIGTKMAHDRQTATAASGLPGGPITDHSGETGGRSLSPKVSEAD